MLAQSKKKKKKSHIFIGLFHLNVKIHIDCLFSIFFNKFVTVLLYFCFCFLAVSHVGS